MHLEARAFGLFVRKLGPRDFRAEDPFIRPSQSGYPERQFSRPVLG